MILMEAKINDQDYCCKRIGYDLVCLKETTEADMDAQGGGENDCSGPNSGL